MASAAAIAAPIASSICSLWNWKDHFSGDSMTPSNDMISDAITFLIGTSSDSMFQPTFGMLRRLSIPVMHSSASANFVELRTGEPLRTLLLGTSVNKGKRTAPWEVTRPSDHGGRRDSTG